LIGGCGHCARPCADGEGFLGEKKIQAVLFDLGETLLNFGKVDAMALFREGGKLAHDFLRKHNQPAGALNFFLLRHLLIIRFFHILSNLMGRDFDSFELLKKAEQRKGVKLSPEQWQEFAWCWYEPLSRFAEIEPDLAETLEKLKSAGIKLGILSNTFVNAVTLDRHLEQFGLLKFFPVRIYSYQFKFRKPDKRIFVQAAEAIGCRPENTLFVGDKVGLDMNGARKANMFAVLKRAYTNGKKIPQGLMVVEKVGELPGIVERINGAREVKSEK
jgi:putative hydrolase of the HAD superfamily